MASPKRHCMLTGLSYVALQSKRERAKNEKKKDLRNLQSKNFLTEYRAQTRFYGNSSAVTYFRDLGVYSVKMVYFYKLYCTAEKERKNKKRKKKVLELQSLHSKNLLTEQTHKSRKGNRKLFWLLSPTHSREKLEEFFKT